MDDGTVFSMNINWALPAVWPGAVYGLEIGIVGTRGVIDIEDTHRDVILASEIGQPAGYNSRGFAPPAPRHVDFIGSYPPGRPLRRPAVGADARGDDDVVRAGLPAASPPRTPRRPTATPTSSSRWRWTSRPAPASRSRCPSPPRSSSTGTRGKDGHETDQRRHHRHRLVRRHPRRHRRRAAPWSASCTSPRSTRPAWPRSPSRPTPARTTDRWEDIVENPTSTRSSSRPPPSTCTTRWPRRRSRPASTCCWRSRSR